ncbi:hypothetical protein HYX70_02550 [Candidatus Saccharibacteria bacterium]|nr:hypothetical protein [Candidatus Saccharibacteria bacterium]
MAMKPVVAQLEKDLDIEIQKLEVWNNAKNQEVMKKYEDIIGEACGGMAGVPSFVNTETKQALCGAHDPADLKLLIDGADCKDNVCKPHSKMKK